MRPKLPNPLKLGPYAALALLAGCGGEAAPSQEPKSQQAKTVTAQKTADSDQSDQQGAGLLTEGFAPIAFDLAGTSWLVVAIDGAPLADRYSDLATVHFTRSMLYWQACNHHEGLYVRTATSFAVGRATATLAICPAGSPDGVMAEVLGGRPLIGGNDEGKVMLVGPRHAITLSQIDARFHDTAPPSLETAPFRLLMPDSGSRPPVLSFRRGAFSVWMVCDDAITGKARIDDSAMRTTDVRTGSCQSDRPTATRALKEFLGRSPSIARGANGELLLSDGDTIIEGRQCHPDPSPCAHATDGA